MGVREGAGGREGSLTVVRSHGGKAHAAGDLGAWDDGAKLARADEHWLRIP